MGGRDKALGGGAEYEALATVEDSKASAGRADYEAVAMVEDYKAPAGDTDHEDLAMVEDYIYQQWEKNQGNPPWGRTS